MDDANDETGSRKVLELIKGIDYALFTTRDAAALHARPMAYRAVENDGDLWFFTNSNSRKVAELRADPTTLVGFADPRRQTFVTIMGESEIVADPAREDAPLERTLSRLVPRRPRGRTGRPHPRPRKPCRILGHARQALWSMPTGM